MSPFSLASSVLSLMVTVLVGGLQDAVPHSSLASVESARSAEVLFGGDMMFDRAIRARVGTTTGDTLFTCIDPVLKDADIVVANLEGPITEYASKSLGSKVGTPNNFIFTFPLKIADLLAKRNIRIVNYGNNHILNFGVSGFSTTLTELERAGVAYFGQAAGQSFVYRTKIEGVFLQFVSYNEFGGNASTTRAQIRRAREDGYVPIVYTHWGNEYETTSAQYTRDLAHGFIDAGAAAVIGSHPHVVQESEIYKGVPIYYSLGNFIFDQYFSADVQKGLLVKLTISPYGVIGVKEIPIAQSKTKTVCPVVPVEVASTTADQATTTAENP